MNHRQETEMGWILHHRSGGYVAQTSPLVTVPIVPEPSKDIIRIHPREDLGLLISDAERETVAQRLQAAFIDGRLTADEFEERQGAAYAARRQSALDATLEGLPKRPAPEPAKDWGVIWVNAMSLLTLTAVIVAGLVAISMTVTAVGL